MRQLPRSLRLLCGSELTDKEFRYLRTVIVTAAVYWGFNSYLRRSEALLNLPAPGGVSPYTSPYGFAETCVFAKQSPGPIHCGSPGLAP